MTYRIEVKDRKEGDQLRDGLADPAVRAFVKVMGVLSQLPSDRARVRVLQFVGDQNQERAEREYRDAIEAGKVTEGRQREHQD